MDKEHIAKELVDSKEIDREYEALLDEYEDALMRVVMYRVAQEEGKHLLREADELEENGVEVPKELDDKCLNLIRSASVQKNQGSAETVDKEGQYDGYSVRHPRLRIAGRIALAAILAAMLLFSVAYAAIPEFRVSVLNFFIDVQENGTFFFFNSDESGASHTNAPGSLVIKGGMPFEFTYVPQGYEVLMCAAKEMQPGTSYLLAYLDSTDKMSNFRFAIDPLDESMGLFVDTEEANVTEIEIQGHHGYRVEKLHGITNQECLTYIWFDLENHRSFSYDSTGIPYEESQKIFDGIVIYTEE